MKKFFGFSLVELMISLIVISIVTAAFAPVITKKLKTSDMSIGSASSEYIYDESICNSSVANCSVCIKDECIRCKNGFFLNGTTGACESCLSNCATCTNSSKCEKCNSGYLIKDSNTKCEAIICKEGCSNCDLTSGCTKCSDGYFLNTTTKECKLCPAGCKTCTGESTCTACIDKYVKTGSTCVKCPNHCETCTSSTQCSECKAGYFLTSDKLCYKYECSGLLCYLTYQENNADKILTIYRYSLGSLRGGPAIPSGVKTCYIDANCDCTRDGSKICSVATCWQANASSGALTGGTGCSDSSSSSFSGCNRIVCNHKAAQLAYESFKSSGMRLINTSDVALINKIVWDSMYVRNSEPFCTYTNGTFLSQCYSKAISMAVTGMNYSYTDPRQYWAFRGAGTSLSINIFDGIGTYQCDECLNSYKRDVGQVYFVK